MKVTVVSDTIQDFNGERFYLCGNYFQHKGKRLHVTVWKYHNGDVPKGFHVHHIDENRANNQIENLRLLPAAIHVSDHAKAREEYNHQHIEDIRGLAAEWHGSDAGRAWHSEHAKQTWENAQECTYTCECCGKPFTTRHKYGEGQKTFCSNACKTMYRTKMGLDNEERVCPYCQKTFIANKYSKKLCCSRECAVKRRWGK